jgi:hypothetical protein
MEKPLTVQSLIRRWPYYANMALAITEAGMPCEKHQPRDWYRRKVIPARYHRAVVIAAHKAKMHDVTHEKLAQMHAPKATIKPTRKRA